MKLPASPLKHLRREIKKRNYATLPFPVPQKELSRAMEHFLDFTELPDPYKKKFRHFINPRDEESFVGYMKRQKERITASTKRQFYDKKEYFHYNHYAEEKFRGLVEAGDERASLFFRSAKKIYKEAESLIRFIVRDIEKEFPGLYPRFFPKDVHPHFYLRFLKYNPEGRGRFLAKAHYDQGAMTLALAESAPGLRIGKNGKTLKAVTHRDRQTIIMPGLQLYRITSEDFRPAWHDVVQKKEDLYKADTARWAVVFFADPSDKERTGTRWDDRHTPIS